MRIPKNYIQINGKEWQKIPGKLSGCSQPGHGKKPGNEQEILDSFLKKNATDLSQVEDIMLDLKFLYEQGINRIYSLAHVKTDRNPELIKYLWENNFHAGEYVTHINNVDIGILDFHAPSQEQLNAITDDAIEHLNKGDNILVHCAFGRGRTGVIITAIYMKLFQIHNAQESIEYIRNYIPGAVEKPIQVEALEIFADSF